VQQHGKPQHAPAHILSHKEDAVEAVFEWIAQLFADQVNLLGRHLAEAAVQDGFNLSQNLPVDRHNIIINTAYSQHVSNAFHYPNPAEPEMNIDY
jgi:hypothetical protein